MESHSVLHSTTETESNYWPGLIDMLTTVLMVFLMVSFLQTTLNIDELNILINQQTLKDRLEDTFQEEIREGTITVQTGLNLLQITFSDVLFKTRDYQLQLAGRRMLGQCAQIFRDRGNYKRIQVEGHTDDRPITNAWTYPHNNWELSTARAISVVRFLTEEARLSPEVFTANGYADYKPVATNLTEEGRAKNRRIEILVLFSTPDS